MPVMGDRTEPWVYWQWEQPQDLALGIEPQTPKDQGFLLLLPKAVEFRAGSTQNWWIFG